MNYRKAYLHLFNEYTDLLKKLDEIVFDVQRAQGVAEKLCTEEEDSPVSKMFPAKGQE